MTVEIEMLKKEIKMLESQKKGLEFSLVERKNRLLAEEMIAEDESCVGYLDDYTELSCHHIGVYIIINEDKCKFPRDFSKKYRLTPIKD